MIGVVQGRLGGGKSYWCVRLILHHIAKGGTVSTNIELIWDAVDSYVRRVHKVVPESDQYVFMHELNEASDFHRYTPRGTRELPALVVIDEGQLLWNSRDWQKTGKEHRELLMFLTQSRKDFTDIYLISQDYKNMDAQFMRLSAKLVTCRDLQQFRVPGLGAVYPFPHFMVTTHDYTGAYQGTELVRKDFKGVGSCYRTEQLIQKFERTGTAEKKTLERIEPKSRMKYVWLAVLLLVFGLGAKLFLATRQSGVGGAAFGSVVKPVEKLQVDDVATPNGQAVVDRRVREPEVTEPKQDIAPRVIGRSYYADEPLRAIQREPDGLVIVHTAFARYRPGATLSYGVVESTFPQGIVKVKLWSGDYLYITGFDEREAIRREAWKRQYAEKLAGTWRPKHLRVPGIYDPESETGEIVATAENPPPAGTGE